MTISKEKRGREESIHITTTKSRGQDGGGNITHSTPRIIGRQLAGEVVKVVGTHVLSQHPIKPSSYVGIGAEQERARVQSLGSLRSVQA